jgi:hypothetical protein
LASLARNHVVIEILKTENAAGCPRLQRRGLLQEWEAERRLEGSELPFLLPLLEEAAPSGIDPFRGEQAEVNAGLPPANSSHKKAHHARMCWFHEPEIPPPEKSATKLCLFASGREPGHRTR